MKFIYQVCSSLLVAGTAFAQASRTVTPPNPTQPGIVSLSAFEVQATQDTGYTPKDTATGLKTGAPIMDVPMGVQIISREMLEDVADYREGIAQTLRYGASGIITYGSVLDSLFMRGTRATGILVDNAPQWAILPDSSNIDSIDVLKGPAAVTYPSTSLSGIVNKNTKRPLGVAQRSVMLYTGSGEFFRAEFDFTGPIYSGAQGRLTYRLIGAYQQSDGFTEPIDYDDRRVVYPSLQYDINQTTVRLQLEYIDNERANYPGSFLKLGADGQAVGPWDGAGKYQTFRSPEWEEHPFETRVLRATAIHRFSSNWQTRLLVSGTTFKRADDELRFDGNPNQVTGIARVFDLDLAQSNDSWHGSVDINGRYRLFGLDHVSTFGASHTDTINNTENYRATLPNVSLFQPIREQSIPKPPASAFTDFGTPNRAYLKFTTAFYMHTVNFWKDRLIGVGGIGYAYNHPTSSRNLRTNVWTSGPSSSANPYRVGLVFKPLPGVSLFANNATTFNAQTNRSINGELVGNREGEVVEFGLKFDTLGGKVSGSVIRYDLDETNLAVLDPSNFGGGIYYIGSGKQLNTGWEVDLAFQPIRNWSTVLTFYSGDIRSPEGDRIVNTIDESASAMTKYTFDQGRLAGLSIGANWFRSGVRWHPASAGGGWPAYDIYNAFVSYGRGKWRVSLNIDNLEDEYYSSGGFLPLQWADIGQPRSWRISYRRKF